MSKSDFPCPLRSQSIIVKSHNLSANSQIGEELWTRFLKEYVNYSCIDFYCVGKGGIAQSTVCRGACRHTSLTFSLGDWRNIAYAETSRLCI